MNGVPGQPVRLCWACGRSGRAFAELHNRLPKRAAWEAGTGLRTLKQLEGRTSYTDAFRLLGIRKPWTSESFAAKIVQWR